MSSSSFIYEAAPELRQQWEADGLALVPQYHVEREGRERSISLRLIPTPSPA